MPPDAPAYQPPSLDLAALRRVHPLWLANRERWLTIREVTSGALTDKAVLSKYLPKGKTEWDDQYRARVNLTEFVPECTVARARIVGALFSQHATRELQGALKEWSESVDAAGHDLDDLAEARIVPTGLDYGAAHVLIDLPDDGGPPPATRAEQIARGIDTPRACVYSPLEVRNWQFGTDGKLEWVLIVELGMIAESPGGPRVQERVYRWFDRNGWAVWRTRGKSGERFPEEHWDADGNASVGGEKQSGFEESVVSVRSAAHGSSTIVGASGRVPLVSWIPDRVDELIGRPMIEAAMRFDLERLVLKSDLAWDLYVHAHPTTVFKTSRQLAEVGVGTNNAIKLDPEKGEDAFVLKLESESFGARERAIEAATVNIHRHMGMDPLGIVTDSPQEASGAARAYSFSTSEARHIGRLSGRMEDTEFELLSIVAEWIGEEPPRAGSVRWPEKFDVTATSDAIEQGMTFGHAVPSRTAQQLMAKKTWRRVLGEVSSEDSAAIDKEIDGADVASPPPMAPQL